MKHTIMLLICMGIILPLVAQQAVIDSLPIRYHIIYQEYNAFYNVIKIKLPPFLSTAEVMEQIRFLLFWPDNQPPDKETRVYVFRDLDPIGTVSRTGCVYIPGKGIFWDLREWQPDSSLLRPPTDWEKQVYNAYLDSLFVHGFYLNEAKESAIKHIICQQYGLTPAQLDTLYYRVKYWWERFKRHSTRRILQSHR